MVSGFFHFVLLPIRGLDLDFSEKTFTKRMM